MEDPDKDPARSWKERVRVLSREALSRVDSGTLTIAGGAAGRDGAADDRGRRGRSMLPALEPGDTVYWARARAAPRRGDVVVFHDLAPCKPSDADEQGDGDQAILAALADTELVVHRVIGCRSGGELTTKGDGRATADACGVSRKMIVGTVEAIHGRGRWRSLRVRRARGFALGAAAISAAGHAAFVVAGAVDRALGRTVPSVGAPSWDRRLCTRRMAWWLQRAAQLIWHAMLDRICHPSIQDPVVSPKSTQRAESRS